MTVRQIFWISLEIIFLILTFGIDSLVDSDITSTGMIVLFILSIILSAITGQIIHLTGNSARYMILLNTSIYFLVMFGIFILIMGGIVSLLNLGEEITWVVGGVLAAFISYLLTSRNSRKHDKQIRKIVDKHIED
jgi:hypothetical protein